MSEPDALVAFNQVSFTHPGKTQAVFDNADFTLSAGEHLGLWGPNGCGKTTFLRILTGLLKPQKGCVTFRGTELRDEKDFRSLRCSIGFVLQNADDQLFFPEVLDDVLFGPLNLKLPPQQALAQAQAALQLLGIEHLEHELTHRLSGGQKKLVSLATVLAMNPEALLLDEPTSGLDHDAQHRLIDTLNTLDITRIIVSHDWDFLAQTATVFATIKNGKIVRCERPASHVHKHTHLLGNVEHDHTEL